MSVCLHWNYLIFAKETNADSTYGSSHTQFGASLSFVRKIHLKKADGKKIEKSFGLNYYPVACEQPQKDQRNCKEIWDRTKDEFRYCQAQEQEKHRGLLKCFLHYPSLMACSSYRLLHGACPSVILQYPAGLTYGLSVTSYTYIQPRLTTCYSVACATPGSAAENKKWH